MRRALTFLHQSSIEASCYAPLYVVAQSRRHVRYASKSATASRSTDSSKSAIADSKSFCMNLFCGRLVRDQVLPFPDVLTEEQADNMKMFVEPSNRFFQDVNNAMENDSTEKISEKSMQGLRELGAFGTQTPEKYGGIGMTNTQYARLGEIIGYNDLGVGISMGAHQSIGFKGILLFGNDEQKQKYLPVLAAGEKLAAFCLTEPSSGSDANSIKSRAVPSSDGKYFTLNGNKIWISNGGIADVFTVFAQVPVINEQTGETRDKVTAFIVERAFKGVSSGPPEQKMGIKCSNTAEVNFDDVKVPAENVLGGVGKGFKVAMNILNNGRFGMAAAMSGTMKFCIDKAVEHASGRVQFDKKLYKFGSIQEKLVKMASLQYVTEAMAYMVAGNMDRGAVDFQLEAAISKIFGSEAAWYCADEAIQILGGMGYMKSTGLERVMRDLRIFRIFEGSNDILRLFISLTGFQYAAPYLQNLEKQIKKMNMDVVFGEGTKRFKRKFLNVKSTESFGSHPSLNMPSEQMSIAVHDFGVAIENLAAQYRRSIVDQQHVLTRLADSAIDIYAMACCLSRCSRTIEHNSDSSVVEHERLLTEAFCQLAYDRIRLNLAMAQSRDTPAHVQRFADLSTAIINNGGLVHSPLLGF